MRVLGVDPGSRITGYGIVESQGSNVALIEAGIIKPRSADALEERIQKIYRNLNDVIGAYRPEVLVLEKLYTHFQYRTTASVLGHVRGAICLLAVEQGLVLAENSVKRIRKALTGNGAATKDQTQAMVAHILHIDPQCLTKDASDALALAIGHLSLSTDRR